MDREDNGSGYYYSDAGGSPGAGAPASGAAGAAPDTASGAGGGPAPGVAASTPNPYYRSGSSYGPGYGYAYAQGAPGYSPYSYTPKPKMSGGKKAFIIILIVVVALGAIGATFVGCVAALSKGNSTDNSFHSPKSPYVAELTVIGEISSANDPYTSSEESYHHQYTLDTIDWLIDDPDNKGLILYVNSPGGGVYESDELYLKIQEYKKLTGCPVYVYMGSMAASGGYYISAPADAIYANRNCWTGSIGVIIGTLFDVSEFLDKIGVKAENITSGPNKDMGSEYTPMTKEQRAVFQGLVDEAYEQFVGLVAEGRGLTVEEVKKIADGRILTAKQAKEAKLIDEIATRDEFDDFVLDEIGGADIFIQKYSYQAGDYWLGTFLDFFGRKPSVSKSKVYSSIDGAVSQGDIAAVLELAEEGWRMPLKYMAYGF